MASIPGVLDVDANVHSAALMVTRDPELNHGHVSVRSLPGHPTETRSSSKGNLLTLPLATTLQQPVFVARIDRRRQFSVFPLDISLFSLDKTNW
jgi:hypothetical protein